MPIDGLVEGSLTETLTGEGASSTALLKTGGTMTGPIVGFEDKGGQVFNVKAYGAKGDGSTDDTAAVSAAITAATTNGGTVYLPPATYVTTTTLTIPTGVSLVGAGMGASVISNSAAVAIVTVSSGTKWSIRNLALVGGASSTIGVACLSGANLGYIKRVRVANLTTGTGIDLANCNEVSITDCTLENNNYGVLFHAYSNACRVSSCNFNAQATVGATGVQIQPTVTSTLVIGCDFEGNANGTNALVCSGTYNTTVLNCYFEQWTSTCILANSGVARGLTVIGCSLQSTSAGAGNIYLASTGPNNGVTLLNNDFPTLGNTNMQTAGIVPGTTARLVALGNTSGGSGTNILNGFTNPDRITITGTAQLANTPAFVAGDHYLVMDSSGNVHLSAVGPAS